MTSGTTDDRYFEWLYGLIGAVRNRNPQRSYWGLARQLFTKEFVWFVPNDDNRVEDGKELRQEFLDDEGTDEVDPEWLHLGCSMLEMLIALSRRASFESDKAPVDWFGIFLNNLELDRYNDALYNESYAEEIDEILDTVIFRNYLPNGQGGLFPLQYPEQDQRKVELWYQLSAYLLEVSPL